MGLKRMIKKSRNTLIAAKLALRRQGWRLSVFPTTLRFLRLSRQFGYEPIEAFRLGMFYSKLSTTERNTFLSRKQTTRIQKHLNPPGLAELFKNKVIFYLKCCDQELPVPRLYGVFSAHGKMLHTIQHKTMRVAADKKIFFDSLPRRFVIKPVKGSLGDGVKIITRTPAGFEDHEGKVYTQDRFVRLLEKTSPVGTLLQEVIENHPEITSFSKAAGLQTVRIITLVTVTGHVEILSAFFKTIVEPDVVIDTHIDNLKGNLEVLIDVSQGTLTQASYLDGDGKGITLVDIHPVSGIPFEGFVIPYWTQVCEMARHAALTALPVRTIGWDIAVTAHGPCLIEGNIWWNPPNQHRVMGWMAERMQTEITKLSRETLFF